MSCKPSPEYFNAIDKPSPRKILYIINFYVNHIKLRIRHFHYVHNKNNKYESNKKLQKQKFTFNMLT